jgi:RHS repeat-associated protein
LARGFFSAGQLTHEQRGETTLRPVGDAGQLLALDRLKADVRQGTATLLGCDAQGSVRVEADQTIRSRRYTAHGGEQDVPVATDLSFGFAGERREPLTGWYIPAGYRPYDPLLMIFLAPDSLSPFGRGGLNAYAYCAGDPVNRIDPDGHSWLTWLVAGVGLALGVVATVASFGAAAPAFAAVYAGGLSALTASGAMAMGAVTLSAISLGTGVASTLLETMDRDSKTANVLGWISLGTGLLGTGLEMAPKGIRLLAKTGRSVGRALNRNTYTYTPMFVNGSITLSSKNKHAGFIKNLHKTPMPAYRNHSNKAMGTVRNLDDVPRSPAELAEDLAPLLRDTPMDIPLVLISCEAGSTGYAQRLANSLNRPVFGYDEVVYIPPPQQMAKPLKSKLPRGEKNWLQNRVIRKTSNPDYGGWRQAYPRLFTPVGWDMPVDPKWLRHLRS